MIFPPVLTYPFQIIQTIFIVDFNSICLFFGIIIVFTSSLEESTYFKVAVESAV
ncbi:MAG: hypothetical protein LBQ59_02415 [Candidatus Peribacteria bacterium]|nr:hypothetical protein [Candidatus Peribacteria bacterium]